MKGNPSSLIAVKQHCENLIDELPHSALNSMYTLQSYLSQKRGKSIRLVGVFATKTPCGLTLAGDDEDIILYSLYAEGIHRQHIIAHEFGHLIFGHQGTCSENVDPSIKVLIKNFPVSFIKRACSH